MRLHSIKLHNIRSYLNQSVDFPEGSVLLAGDIGSGKSTILLAIEFALFGSMHGSGNALLRAGKNEASVELKFSVEGNEIIIKRVLKRSKDKVMQNSGYIIKDGMKKEATAIELKSDILELIGYPKELLTKSKNLIYRYTVYTPQEDMKMILSEEKDLRLDTLRRVFGIDKYKRIRENATLYVRELNTKTKLLEGKVFDLNEKENQKEELKKGLTDVDLKISEFLPKLKRAKTELEEKRRLLLVTEELVKKQREAEHAINIQNTMLNVKLAERERISREIAMLKEETKKLETGLGFKPKASIEELQSRVSKTESEIRQAEDTWKNHVREKSKLAEKLENSLAIQEKISTIDKCPLCLQDVSEAHKYDIHEREEKKIEELRKLIQESELAEKREKESINSLRESVEGVKKELHQCEIYELKEKNLREKSGRIAEFEKSQENSKAEIGKINAKKIELQSELKNIDISGYEAARKSVDQVANEEKQLSVEFAKLEKEKEGLGNQLEIVEKEIQQRHAAKKQMESIRTLRNWLEGFFVELMSSMERHVMSEIYSEFNSLFQQWFRMLIEDEILNVRLDEEFTPVIEQNGYEIELDNLSGGEKTSVALAYRLSLNKVINDVVSTIKTKDIIILDEPTDGFSTEQLDKVKEVIEQLRIPQVILVSHEPKIESFVDNILRVRKEEHVSIIS